MLFRTIRLQLCAGSLRAFCIISPALHKASLGSLGRLVSDGSLHWKVRAPGTFIRPLHIPHFSVFLVTYNLSLYLYFDRWEYHLNILERVSFVKNIPLFFGNNLLDIQQRCKEIIYQLKIPLNVYGAKVALVHTERWNSVILLGWHPRQCYFFNTTQRLNKRASPSLIVNTAHYRKYNRGK